MEGCIFLEFCTSCGAVLEYTHAFLVSLLLQIGFHEGLSAYRVQTE